MQNPVNIRLIIEQASAGGDTGTERPGRRHCHGIGLDGVLMNTAIAEAKIDIRLKP